MRGLLRFLAPYKKQLVIGPFFKLLEAILELFLPTVMALVVNNGVAKGDGPYVVRMGLVMLGMSVLGFCCSLVCQWNAAHASQGFGTDLRASLFARISSFSYAELDSFGTQTLTTRLTNDVNQLQLAVAMLIRLVVRAPFICVGAIVMALILNARLSLILIAVTPFFALLIYFLIAKSSPLYRACQRKLDLLGSLVGENLSGVRVIRAFAKSAHERARFEKANDDLSATLARVTRLSALLSPATSFIVNAAIVAILWAGGLEIDAGGFSQGGLIAYINYVTQVLLALIVVSNLVVLFTKAFASAGRVAELLDTEPSITGSAPALPEVREASGAGPAARPLVEFREVSFAYYHTAERALEGIDLSMGEGESLGIIGATGSGKTSLVNLVGRFYEATEGRVLFLGRDVRDWPLEELRRQIGYVPQESLLFTGTVASNLRLGAEGASEEELREAARIAQAESFIEELPGGYESPVLRGGKNFSGGQRQRLAIARALAARPRLIILDDSTSALDFLTEANFRRALASRRPGLATIFISQRTSSIRDCDRIVVMDDGRIAAQGSHDELLASCGLYREICRAQDEKGKVADGGAASAGGRDGEAGVRA